MKGLLIDVHNAKIQEVEVSILHPERLVVEFMILFAMTKDFFMSQCWYLLLILNRMQC